MEHPSRVGKYQVEQYLGGGMSRVYRARDTILGREVAVKILSEGCDEEAKARFLHEARIASNINHENVISVYDFGEDAGRPFIVMEFLEGQSLRQALRENTVGDFNRRIQIALQVARAIEFIHSRKVVHRDIKPENVKIDASGRAKLMDFGIAKSEGPALTRVGYTFGTPFYMAPEQVLGEPVSALADVYSFGLLLYELLSGARAVQGQSFDDVFDNILTQPIAVEPLVDAGVPSLVIDMILRCTAKPLAERPRGMGAICGQLESLLDASRHSSRRSPEMAAINRVNQSVMAARTSQELPAWLKALPAPLRSQVGLALLSAAVVLAVALAALKFARLI